MTTEREMTLPIQGDRLLLTLDLLLVWMGGNVKEKNFSPSRVQEIISRFVSDKSNMDDPTCCFRFEDAYDDGGFIAIHALLITARDLHLVTFDASTLIGFDSPFCGYFPYEVVNGFHQLFKSIACGELTEADFRE